MPPAIFDICPAGGTSGPGLIGAAIRAEVRDPIGRKNASTPAAVGGDILWKGIIQKRLGLREPGLSDFVCLDHPWWREGKFRGGVHRFGNGHGSKAQDGSLMELQEI
jgi:hypothetical protein